MKIGIITFNSAHNYGAVLQVWALQEKLKEDGHQVEVINYRTAAIDNLYRVYVPRWITQNELVNRGFHKLQYMKARVRIPQKAARFKKFEDFINKTLPTTKPYHRYSSLINENFDYDVMIAGSDQIWNGNITKGLSEAYFLGFGKKSIKRISYAASIGKDSFDPEEKLVVQSYLKNLDYISVREEKLKHEVQALTSKEVELVLDPTLLLDKEKYDKIRKDTKVKQDYIFVHNVHLVKIDERLNAIVEEVSKRTGLPVINNRADYNFSNEIDKFTEGGPEEFLGIIAGAKMVITNSFHATVFSIIYERNFITVPHFKNPDRMQNLLHMFQLDNHLIDSVNALPDNLNSLEIDYHLVAELRKSARDSSEKFLKKALHGEKTVGLPVRKEELYFTSKDKFTCYGCGACVNTVGSPDYKLTYDEEGFLYPNVDVLNKEQLTLCQEVCPYKNKNKPAHMLSEMPDMFQTYLKDTDKLMNSSNGGTLRALAEAFAEQGGMVAGIAYTDFVNLEYVLATAENLPETMFKYYGIETDCTGIHTQIKEQLDAGKFVLYFDTPYHLEGLKLFLGKEYERLYTVTMQTNGTISGKVYQEYIKGLENRYHSKVRTVDLENKSLNAATPFVCITFDNDELYAKSLKADPFTRTKAKELLQRPCCYNSDYGEIDGSIADIILKVPSPNSIEMNLMGEDITLVLSKKGHELFTMAKKNLNVREELTLSAKIQKPQIKNARYPLMQKLAENDIVTIFSKPQNN